MSMLNKQGLNILVDEIKKDTNKKVNAISDKIGNEILLPKDNTKHTTVNGVKEFECEKDGYVDNIYIEGKTYVNYINNSSILTGESNFLKIDVNNKDMFDDGDYTIINLSDKLIRYIIRDNNGSSRSTTVQPNSKNSTILTNEYFSGLYGDYSEGWSNDVISKALFDKSVLILKGEIKNSFLTHFKGMYSVGQNNKLSVITRSDKNSDNLLNNIPFVEGKIVKYVDGTIDYSDVQYGGGEQRKDYKATEQYIQIKPNTLYYFLSINLNIAFYDSNKVFIPLELGKGDGNSFFHVSPSNAKFLRVTVYKPTHGTPSVIEGYNNIDIQQIKNTFRSTPNGVNDLLVKYGNKYYKIQLCKEIILDGTCTVKDDSSLYNDTSIKPFITDTINDADVTETNTFDFYCDKFKTKNIYNVSNTDEGIYYSKSKNFHLRILKSKLATPNADGVKKWLEENPITIVYKLANPIITELINFNPRTFKGKNIIIFNSGSVQCEADFESSNSLRNELDIIKDIIQKKQTIHYSTVAPTNDQGEDGDIWVIYSEEETK